MEEQVTQKSVKGAQSLLGESMTNKFICTILKRESKSELGVKVIHPKGDHYCLLVGVW